MQQLEEMTVRGATETIPLGEKSIFAVSYLGKLSALYRADKFTVARLMKVVVIAETFIIRGFDSWTIKRSSRAAINIRRVPQASGFSRAYCISFSVNEETISASNKLRR